MKNYPAIFINRLFLAPEEPQSSLKIIIWWEYRRIPYNIIIAIIGFISFLSYTYFIIHAGNLREGEDAVEPVLILAAPILINIAYTFGWIIELILRFLFRFKSKWIGPTLFGMGLAFSIFIILFPTIFWGTVYIIKSIC